jgi:hypothetical protein
MFCRGKLWQPDATMDGEAEVELHAPCLLAIPKLLLDLMRAEGKLLMPPEVHILICTNLAESADDLIMARIGE